MPKYSEQDLKYAAEFREGIHREALAIVRKTRPGVTEVIDRHPVEEYFQENWEYPGRWYTIVAIPYGYRSRKALVDAIVRDTLAGKALKDEPACSQMLQGKTKPEPGQRNAESQSGAKPEEDPFYALIAGYPDLALDYCIVKEERYAGCESHRKALKTAFERLGGEWRGDPGQAAGKRIAVEELFSAEDRDGKLNYRKAFLCPPHGNSCTAEDFERVNKALFPNGTGELQAYEWSTDWSDYFDEGREWWGTLCLTVYDKTLGRFAVIMASATD
ncbi:MAG: hypothetical protein K5981_01655 [Clostridia bacterium]|nr:hypothetical protein [Clostridia bacterium]